MPDNTLEKASDFQPLPGEANFPPTILTEVKGGAHIAPECLTYQDGKFIMVEWPTGLPRHDDGKQTLRFPHGLMRFGEPIEECAKRLVSDQLGMRVDMVKTLKLFSYLDKMNHWHLEPLLLVKVAGDPHLPKGASRTVSFFGRTLPKGSVWSEGEFEKVYDEFFHDGLT